MLNAAALVQKIVAEEIVKGIPADRIAVGGINEGFEVGLLATVGDKTKIAGTVGITEGLKYTRTIVAQKKAANAETLVSLIVHAVESGNVTRDGILGTIGQLVGALIYENEALNTEGQLLSGKASHAETSFKGLVLITIIGY